ncbi:MAG: glycerophosphodiester phosphodiesterase family protein [Leptospiraceae bacterium]|nr:glycerophosphodiester phosphodiesterase family protein [Leptospiraceae bacterium]
MRLFSLTFVISIFYLFAINCTTSYHFPRKEVSSVVLSKNFHVIAHRGSREFAPENTMTAFRMAAKLGAGFELDTMQCKTGELVVIHDTSIDRTTNGKGNISELTLSEIKSLDAGSFFIPMMKENLKKWPLEEIKNAGKNGLIFSKKFKGNIEKLSREELLSLDESNFLYSEFKNEKIPTLDEVLDEFGGKTIVDIEIKSTSLGNEAVKLGTLVANLITKKKLTDKVFVTSFSPKVLVGVKEGNKEILQGQLYSNFDHPEIPIIVKIYGKLFLRSLSFNDIAKPDLLAMGKEMITPEYVKEMKGYGYKLFPWTVNDRSEMEKLIALGVDGLISDRPDLVIEEFNKQNKVSLKKELTLNTLKNKE